MGGSRGAVGWGGADREASGLREGWTGTETERGERERWMQLRALVRGKVTLWVKSSPDTASSVTTETQLMNTCTERSQQITVYQR